MLRYVELKEKPKEFLAATGLTRCGDGDCLWFAQLASDISATNANH